MYTVNYTDSKGKVGAFVDKTIEDLNGSVSGVIMDRGTINFVVNEKGEKVTAKEIGAAHVEDF